jgi:chromosome segregation ATPase
LVARCGVLCSLRAAQAEVERTASGNATLTEQLTAATADLTSAQAAKRSADTALAAANAQHSDWTKEKAALSAQIDVLSRRCAEADRSRASNATDSASLSARLAEAQSEIDRFAEERARRALESESASAALAEAGKVASSLRERIAQGEHELSTKRAELARMQSKLTGTHAHAHTANDTVHQQHRRHRQQSALPTDDTAHVLCCCPVQRWRLRRLKCCARTQRWSSPFRSSAANRSICSDS